MENVPRWRRPRLLGLFSSGEMAFANQIAAGSEQPALADMTRRAIELLQWNPGGYLLIVDAGLMGAAARQNRGEMTLAETVELDRAVAVRASYTGENSTILVAGNFGIGGLALNGFPFRRDKGIALLGVNAAGEPALTWATGPNGPEAAGNSRRSTNPRRAEDAARSQSGNQEPAAVYAPARAWHGGRCSGGRPRTREARLCTAFSITRSFSESFEISYEAGPRIKRKPVRRSLQIQRTGTRSRSSSRR